MMKENKISITDNQNPSISQVNVKEVSSYVGLNIALILQLNRTTE